MHSSATLSPCRLADARSWQFQKALHVAENYGWIRFVSMQDHLNLIYREEEREMLPLCREEKIGGDPV
jgi:1-deoxyxylulose-5-phosphate synthase